MSSTNFNSLVTLCTLIFFLEFFFEIVFINLHFTWLLRILLLPIYIFSASPKKALNSTEQTILVCSVSEAGGDLVLIKISLLLWCKTRCIYMTKQGHLQPRVHAKARSPSRLARLLAYFVFQPTSSKRTSKIAWHRPQGVQKLKRTEEWMGGFYGDRSCCFWHCLLFHQCSNQSYKNPNRFMYAAAAAAGAC